MSERGPKLARWLVTVLTAEEDRPYVLWDLEEGYRRGLARMSRGQAVRWYWWQALRAIPAWGASCRDDRGDGAMTKPAGHLGLTRELRVAVRSLLRRRLYAGGVIGTLGLGLGAAAAIVAVAWGVWFSALPFADADRVVRVYEVNLRPEGDEASNRTRVPGESGASEFVTTAVAVSTPSRWNALSPPLVTDLERAKLSTIAGVAAVAAGEFDWTRGDVVRRVSAQIVSVQLFALFGVRTLHGRVPGAEPGVREVALTREFWEDAFGSDARVIGRNAMVLDGESYAIVGVIEAPYGYPPPADIWVPLVFQAGALEEGMRGARYLEAVARVRTGHSVEDAAAELDGFVKHLAEAHPNHRGWGAHAVRLREDLVRPFRSVLLVLLATATAFVLLATVNVAGLVAARRVENRHARAVRMALGASRGQVLREGIVESTLLGLAAALLAALGAYWVLASIKRLMPADVPRLSNVAIGGGLVGSLLAAGVVAGLLVGLLGHLMSGIRDRPAIGRNRDAERPGVRGRRALLITQIALTTWMLLAGVALIRHVNALRSVDVGFEADAVLAAPVTLSHLRQGASPERSLLFWEAVLRGLEARSVTAAVATNPPISGSTMRYGYALQGDRTEYWGQYHAVTGAYFEVLGIDLVAGRAFTQVDGPGAAPVVIVNEELARLHFRSTDPIGRSIMLVGTRRTIVGVVRSTRHFGPDRASPAELYVPLAQDPSPFAHVLVRTAGAAAGMLSDVIAPIDPQLATAPLAPFKRYLTTWFAPFRLQLVVLGVLASVGAILAALGIYALVAYIVSSSAREIGIRIALGERSDAVFRRTLGHGLVMAAIGAIAGIAGTLATREAIRLLIRGVEPLDPVVMLVVVAVVSAIALLASIVPAQRALRMDPIIVLRAE